MTGAIPGPGARVSPCSTNDFCGSKMATGTPNPCYDLLFLESTYLIKEIYLFTISGQLIYDWQSNNNQVSFNLDWLKKGTYILNVVYDNKKNNNYAIVKK